MWVAKYPNYLREISETSIIFYLTWTLRKVLIPVFFFGSYEAAISLVWFKPELYAKLFLQRQ
jgi:hypothetical protein